ncbi:serine protease 7-like [Drosophila ficusphila]|uniref:serine protease 7-like n=1 Tax=Drosophila ficusphila TaxID=30025 RepID=UPI0007E6C834|nr:serine protease 7-like [Drosophila ficusphila]
MKVFAVALLCLQVFCNANQTNLTPCQNPNHRDGYCIDIDRCMALSWKSEEARSLSERRFIERSICHPYDNPRLVCCTMDTDFVSDLSVCGKNSNIRCYSNACPSVRGEFAWMVLLEFLEEAKRCAGNLINHHYVLTAAHCLDEPPVSVILGIHHVRDVRIVRRDIKEIIIHERWNHVSYDYDIALIRLKRRVAYSPCITPVCLPSSVRRTWFDPGYWLTAAGWGDTEHTIQNRNVFSRTKLKARVSYVDWAWCKQQYSKKNISLATSQMCAGGEADACQGDSGGPLMSSFYDVWVLEGIVSYGHRHCGQTEWPGIYINVTFFENWIMDQISPIRDMLKDIESKRTT